MKKQTRAWRRWGERAARWGLTLLLVALVGVTVASAWWQLLWARHLPWDGGASTMFVAIQVQRGNVIWASDRSPWTYDESSRMSLFEVTQHRRLQFIFIPASPAFGGPGRPEPPLETNSFNLWRVAANSMGYRVPLTYATAAVALPALFLWYRRFRKRYRRGLCARCGYDLAGLAAVEERIVCPECGAANAAGRGGGGPTMLKAKTP